MTEDVLFRAVPSLLGPECRTPSTFRMSVLLDLSCLGEAATPRLHSHGIRPRLNHLGLKFPPSPQHSFVATDHTLAGVGSPIGSPGSHRQIASTLPPPWGEGSGSECMGYRNFSRRRMSPRLSPDHSGLCAMPHSYVDVVVKRPAPLGLSLSSSASSDSKRSRYDAQQIFAESENADAERYASVPIGVARKIVETQLIETLLCAQSLVGCRLQNGRGLVAV